MDKLPRMSMKRQRMKDALAKQFVRPGVMFSSGGWSRSKDRGAVRAARSGLARDKRPSKRKEVF